MQQKAIQPIDGYRSGDELMYSAVARYGSIANYLRSVKQITYMTNRKTGGDLWLIEEHKNNIVEEPQMNEIMTINNINCYEENGVAYLHLETCARGLGFTTVATSGNDAVRWQRVYQYLVDLGVATSCNDEIPYKERCPEFIPENIFYRLAMKAKNEAAEKFQALVADEIIPAIRKTGTYSAQPLSPLQLLEAQVQVMRTLEQKQTEQQAAIETVTTRLDNIGEIIALNPSAWREESRRLIARIANALGGAGYIRDVNAEIYSLMLSRFSIDLTRRLNNKRAKMALEGANRTQQNKLTKVDIIADDKRAIEAYLTVIKEMAIKYGVDTSA